MNHRSESQYICDLQKVDLSLPDRDAQKIASIFGITVKKVLYPTKKQSEWAKSELRRKLNYISAAFIYYGYLQLKEIQTVNQLHGKYGQQPYYEYLVGFPFDKKRWSLRKIRTMVNGAEFMLDSPFDFPAFPKKCGNGEHDKRILDPLARQIRRESWDEIPQMKQAADPKSGFELIGTRAYTEQELYGLEILWDLAMKAPKQIGFDSQLVPLFETYREMIPSFKPQPCLFTTLTATRSKDTPIMARIAGEMAFSQYDSPKSDLKIALASGVGRMNRVGVR